MDLGGALRALGVEQLADVPSRGARWGIIWEANWGSRCQLRLAPWGWTRQSALKISRPCKGPMTSETPKTHSGRGPSLSPEERDERQRIAKRVWKAAHHIYVRTQIRALASRPEYLERRRLLHKLKRQALIDAGVPVRNVGRPRKIPLTPPGLDRIVR